MTNPPKTVIEALNKLSSLAKDEKNYHSAHGWTEGYSRELKAYFAGVDMDKFMRQFTRRESAELFKQRKDITAHIQKSLGNRIDKPFSKIRRSNWTMVLSFDDDPTNQKVKDFEARAVNAWGKAGLTDYIFERLRYWNAFDPNAFIVVETSAENPNKPYPFEATSELVCDYLYDVYGNLQYLAVCIENDVKDSKGNKVEIKRLTIYLQDRAISLQGILDEHRTYSETIRHTEFFKVDPEAGDLIKIDNKLYRVELPTPHNFGYVPAIRAGFIPNPEDDGKTVLSIFDAGLPFAKKLLKINSELDLVTALLAFPVSVRHEDRCDNTGCNRGELPDGGRCMVCHGSGYKPRPTSAQEEILLPLPDRPEDMLDVSKIISYTYPPTDAVRLQIEIWDKWTQAAIESVFNSQMNTKAEVAQTARYYGIQLDSIYDTLHPYAAQISNVWQFILKTSSRFIGAQAPPTAALMFPADFRFETADDLFLELQSARNSGAGNDAISLLQGRMMQRLLIDDREAYRRWEINNRLNPFAGMSDAEILFAINSGLVPEWKKVGYINRMEIMQSLTEADPMFYVRPFPQQQAAVKAKAEEIAATLQASQPGITIPIIPANAE